MKRLLSVFVSTAVAVSGATVLLGPAAPAAGAEDLTPTSFAFTAKGFGTRLAGGEVPVDSRTTSYEAIGCTNSAGKVRENHVAQAVLPGAGTASQVRTDLWTAQSRSGVTVSHAKSTVEKLVLGEPSAGSVEINALRTHTRAIHDDSGFRAVATSSIGSIFFTDPSGEKQELDIPAPGQPVEVPGLLRIEIGRSLEQATAEYAKAAGEAIVVEFTAAGTRLKVAHGYSYLERGVKSGLFSGRSSAVRSSALQDNVTVGEQPLSIMPCQGTDGELRHKALVDVHLDDGLVLEALSSSLRADQDRTRATGMATGQVAGVNLGNGQLTVDGVIGRVNVKREGSRLVRNIKGSSVGTITIDGQVEEFPDSDVIEVPNVLRLERNIVRKTKTGIAVTALRITLLEGDGAVIDLGRAFVEIRRADR